MTQRESRDHRSIKTFSYLILGTFFFVFIYAYSLIQWRLL